MKKRQQRVVDDDSEPIGVLGLHCRITNRLSSMGVYRINALCACTPGDLMRQRGIAHVSVHEIEVALRRIGRSLRAEDAQ